MEFTDMNLCKNKNCVEQRITAITAKLLNRNSPVFTNFPLSGKVSVILIRN